MLKHANLKEKRTLDFSMKADDVKDDGSFVCYASIFNNVDQGGDVIAPGAFGASLADAKAEDRLIPLLWQHNRDEPIGGWTKFTEDEKGLKAEGYILEKAGPVEKRALAHLKAGTVGGFSIGYRLKADGYSVHPDYDDGDGIWLLSDIDLREVSLVTMPMNLEARLVSVKNALASSGMPTQRDFEFLLRDACGFTRKAARDLSIACRPMLQQVEPGASSGKSTKLLESIASALEF